MPEGDTLFKTATELDAALRGTQLIRLSGSHPALRKDGRRLVGATIDGVEAVGKHLLVHFDHGWSLRTHLGMPGVWHLYRSGARWRKTPGKARVVLSTSEWDAVCFSAPTVHVGTRSDVTAAVSHLGPDLLGAEPDWSVIVTRARTSSAATAADLLLDQRVMAGLGNVYKSETLFLERVDPATVAGALDDATITALAQRGRRLLMANRTRTNRSTTGDRRRDQRTWVYGRGGRPCRRCGTPIASDTHGELDRITYWCPSCQAPGPGADPITVDEALG